ncbi:MAG TPA: FtsX-like permease family protein, partial [Clostridia bacterium]
SGAMPAKAGEVLIGSALADEIGIGPGDKLQIANPQGDKADWVVSGVFDLKVAALNKTWIVSDLNTVRSMFDRASSMERLTSIEMQVTDVFSADVVAAGISTSLPAGLAVTDWKAQNAELLSGLAGQSASSYMIQVFVLLAVALGIGAVLAVSVVQKSRQLGILKAMGIQDRAASLIFLFQGVILGLAGSAVGVAMGIGLSYAFSTFVQNPDGTPLVPFLLDIKFIALSVVTALLAATVAALVPARASSRLNPIEVIRNG